MLRVAVNSGHLARWSQAAHEKIDGQRLSSLFPHIAFSTNVSDLGAMLDSELTFSHHINLIARKCYYQLRQLRVVSRSLTHQSRGTLVHAFVTSRIDCCCSLLAGLPLGTLAQLDRVLHSAACLVGGLSKFSSITAYMRDVLHWLFISERIQYRITAMVSHCVLGCAPSYLRDLCCPVSVLAHVGCCVLLQGVSFWSLGRVWQLCSEGPFRLWVHQHGMISPLSCIPC